MTPLQINDAEVTIGTNTTAGDEVTSVTLRPTTTRTAWQPVSGKDQNVYSAPSWELLLTVGQDFAASSLMAQLIKGHGTVETFTVKPKTGGSASFTGDVRLAFPDNLLGPRGGIATTTVTLSVQDQPTILDDTGTQLWPAVEAGGGGEV